MEPLGDPFAALREEPKAEPPRSSPSGKLDRAAVEAKMRTDGWTTTEKARANAADGSSRTADKYFTLDGDPKTYRSLPEVARAYYPDLVGDETATPKKKRPPATTLRKRDRDAAARLHAKLAAEEARCASLLDEGGDQEEDLEELRASLLAARWAVRRSIQAMDAHEPPFLLDAARRPPARRDYTIRCAALLGSGAIVPRIPDESEEAAKRKQRAKAQRDRKWTRPIPCQLPAPPWPAAPRFLGVRSSFAGQRTWKALGGADASSLARVSRPFWGRFDDDRVPGVEPSSRYVNVRLTSKRLRIASQPTLAAVPLEYADAGVHAAVRAAHAALGRVARARRAQEALLPRPDVSSDEEAEPEEDEVVDISNFKYAARGRAPSPLLQQTELAPPEEDEEDDALCHMSGRLSRTTFAGTWAFERDQPLRWPFAFELTEDSLDDHGDRLLSFKGTFEGGGVSVPVADSFECVVQKSGRVDGKGRSRFGAYAIQGVLAYDGEELVVTKRPPNKVRAVRPQEEVEEDEDAWAQCDACQKWRLLPKNYVVDESKAWNCASVDRSCDERADDAEIIEEEQEPLRVNDKASLLRCHDFLAAFAPILGRSPPPVGALAQLVNIKGPMTPLDRRLAYDVHAPLLRCALGDKLFACRRERPEDADSEEEERLTKRDVFEDDVAVFVDDALVIAPEAEDEPDGAAADWHTSGPYVGAWTSRVVLAGAAKVKKKCVGRVEGYLPPEEADFLDKDDKPCALWRIRYVTGELEDELEDVEWHELLESTPRWIRPRVAGGLPHEEKSEKETLKAMDDATASGLWWSSLPGPEHVSRHTLWPALLAACAFRAAKVDVDSSVQSQHHSRAIRAASQLRASRADYGALDADARLALLDALVHACCETWDVAKAAAKYRGAAPIQPPAYYDNPLKVDEYRPSKKKAVARKTSSGPRSAAPLPMTAVAALISADVPLRVRQENPKGGASKARFDKYMAAQSAREFIVLGGTKGDLQYDMIRGHVHLLSGDGPDAHDIEWRKDPRVIAATIG